MEDDEEQEEEEEEEEEEGGESETTVLTLEAMERLGYEMDREAAGRTFSSLAGMDLLGVTSSTTMSFSSPDSGR